MMINMYYLIISSVHTCSNHQNNSNSDSSPIVQLQSSTLKTSQNGAPVKVSCKI